MKRAIFLDRDGVIIENRDDYVRSWQDVSFIPRSIDAIVEMRNSTYLLVIVTNQSAVGRGLVPLTTANSINRKIIRQIEDFGGHIDRLLMCPHAPFDRCDCRKPAPGLLLQAARELNIDLEQSVIIGDALTDIEAGKRAGIGRSILVMTGRGLEQINTKRADAEVLQPIILHNDLYDACLQLLGES